MGSGKTRVGELLARRLSWAFRDFDREIESRLGLPISEIFRQHGEGFFRAEEKRVGEELLKGKQVVLASGGGWPIAPDRLNRQVEGTFSVWLKISPEEAIRRAREDGPTRPLLASADPLEEARALLKEREPYYARADIALDSTGQNAEQLAKTIQKLITEERQASGLHIL
jgi:shikimate kinase